MIQALGKLQYLILILFTLVDLDLAVNVVFLKSEEWHRQSLIYLTRVEQKYLKIGIAGPVGWTTDNDHKNFNWNIIIKSNDK